MTKKKSDTYTVSDSEIGVSYHFTHKVDRKMMHNEKRLIATIYEAGGGNHVRDISAPIKKGMHPSELLEPLRGIGSFNASTIWCKVQQFLENELETETI